MAKHVKTFHESYGFNRDFMGMTLPLYMIAFFYYGPRVLLLAFLGVVVAKLCDHISASLRGRRYDKTENLSTLVALIIVLMLPATVGLRVVIGAVAAAVFVGKEAFGGSGSYPFNPAAVGFCVAAVSWPEQVYRYPSPIDWTLLKNMTGQQAWRLWAFEGTALTQSPAATLRSGGLPKVEFFSLLLGNYAGPLGAGCTLVIMACALYLVVKKRLPVPAPFAFLTVSVLITFVFPRSTDISFATWPGDFMLRLQVVKFELLLEGLVFMAVFLVPEACTLPKNKISQLIYGAVLGVVSTLFRYYGSFELGTCFAFLIVNSVSGYFDRAVVEYLAGRKGVAVS